MRKRVVKQFAIVQGDSAQTFTDELNRKLIELEGKDISIDFYENFLGARISWPENIGEEPETVEEEYEVLGAGFRCNQCPMFQLQLKADGTADSRAKFGRCILKDYGRVCGTSRACEKLYQMIQSGEVQLCLAD